MTVKAKICGLRTSQSVQAAVSGGASYIGFVFYEKSPRNITPEQGAALTKDVPESVIKTGVFVDPDDDQLHAVLDKVPLDLIQLHGAESIARVRDIKTRFKIPVMKAFAISSAQDITRAKDYEKTADLLLFDAKAPKSYVGALPGGNGLSFDWQLIRGTDWQIPWMLSGGLDAGNVTEAVETSCADMVDVSSGVESRPGQKNIQKIETFLATVKGIEDTR